MTSLRRPGTVLLAWLLLAAAWADGFSVQTVAVRDLRIAERIAEELGRSGFDAYTEFAMSRGQQWTRVRVGCYADHALAQAFAELLRHSGHPQAAVVERTAGAPTRGCVIRDVGFRTPPDWQQPQDGQPTFHVVVGNVTGMLRYDGRRWQVLQAPATELLPIRSAPPGHFRPANGTALPFLVVELDDGPMLLCPGEPLASTEGAAIVRHGDLVVACRVEPDPETATSEDDGRFP